MSFVKFDHVSIRKRDFFTWLTTELERNGWVRIESNYTGEGWIYQSKGVDGKQDILVNFKDGYETHLTFSNGNNRYFDIRMLVSYTPSGTPGVNGKSVPTMANSQYIRVAFDTNLISSDVHADGRYDIYFNCNKDRIVMLIKGRGSSNILMFGKPSKRYAKDYKDTGNMLVVNNGYKLFGATTWGIADRPNTEPSELQLMYVNTGRGFYDEGITLSELGFGSATEGFKGFVEGVYCTNHSFPNGKLVEDDKLVDDLGNEFSIFFPSMTTGDSYNNRFPNLMLLACTRLAGETNG